MKSQNNTIIASLRPGLNKENNAPLLMKHLANQMAHRNNVTRRRSSIIANNHLNYKHANRQP
jgi:hypothetical protein